MVINIFYEMNFLSFITFVPSLMYDIFSTILITDKKWYDRIDDIIVLGALPFPNFTDKLLNEENVKAVISLNETYELWFANGKKRWKNVNVQFLQLPTPDIFEAPSLEDLQLGVRFIQEFSQYSRLTDASNPKPSIYVHCKAGKMRSATLVACYLMEKHGWDPERAVHHLKSKRPHVLLFKKNWDVMWDYYNNLEITRI